MLNRNSENGFGFIARVVWLCYGSLSLAQLGVSEISTCVQVSV
jgi:hypothetical protein